jgi:oligosaccharide repeat unit polymerase
MIATTFNILVLLVGLTWFLFLSYRQKAGKYFLITPFFLFGFFEIISKWGVPLNFKFKGEPLDGWEILVIGSVFVAFVTGFFLTGGKNIPIKPYLSKPITAKYHAQYYFMGVLLSMAFLISVGLFYYRGAPALGISVFELIKGNLSMGELTSFMSDQRLLLTKSQWFGGEYRGQGALNIVMRVGWRFVFGISLIMYLTLQSRKWLFLSILTGLLLVLFQSGSGERAPLVFSVLFTVILLSLMQKTSPKHFFVLATLGFSFLMVTTYFSSRGALLDDSPDFVSKIASTVIERIFLGSALHDLETIEFVDTGILEKRMGMYHIEKFFTSFPGIRMGEPLGFRLSYLRGSREGVFSSTTYLGICYADFGYLGTIIIYFLIGVFLSYSQRMLLSMERDIIGIVLSSMIIFYLGFIYQGGFIGFASSMVIVLLFWLIFHFFGTIFSNRPTSSLPAEKTKLLR